jgi:hypothetical protein
MSGADHVSATTKRLDVYAVRPPRGMPALCAHALDAFEETQVRHARRAWSMKSAQELRSAAIFSELVRLAIDCGLAGEISKALASCAEDEMIHAELCRLVAKVFGAEPPVVDMKPVEDRLLGHREPWRRFLALLLVEVAIGETISTSLFRAGAKSSAEPLTRHALTMILRDEAQHARIGWEVLEVLRPIWTVDDRRFLDGELRAQLGAIEQSTAVPSLRLLASAAPFDPTLGRLGLLSPERRVEAFYEALEGKVLPALDALGLAGSASWAARYTRPA